MSISTICLIVSILAVLMLMVSVHTNKSRRTRFAWLAVFILALIVNLVTPAKSKVSETAPEPAATSTASEPTTMTVPDALAELTALLKEVETMRLTGQAAGDWEKRLKEARDRFEHSEALPRQLRMVPVALLSLGQNYLMLKTENLDEGQKAAIEENIKTDLEEIYAGLNWKPGD